MSNKNKNNHGTRGSENTAAEHTAENVETAEHSTEEGTETAEHSDTAEGDKAGADVVVTEQPAASTLSIVPTAVAAEVAKVRLFWQKSCGSMKDSTLTPIKDDEVFVKTTHMVGIIPAGSPEGTAAVPETVYSLKRGKRIYYTPSSFITDAQRLAADTATSLKNQEKEAAAKAKADEKAKKEQAKKDAVAAGPTVVPAPQIVAAPVAEASAEEVK